MKRLLAISSVIFLSLVLGLTGFVAWFLYPHYKPQALPEGLFAATSQIGLTRIETAEASTDYDRLSKSFQAQSLVSYCGVASSVSVLNALGESVSQQNFFTSDASLVRSRLEVMFAGMSLPELAGLLKAYGLRVSVKHIDQVSIEKFREILIKNLLNGEDYLIVNYQREVLGQGRVGHISPLAAYHHDTESVLVMDTAAHKYPPTWVPLKVLYAAMQTIDAATGKTRGYVEVSK